jgi:hypothetical protein
MEQTIVIDDSISFQQRGDRNHFTEINSYLFVNDVSVFTQTKNIE